MKLVILDTDGDREIVLPSVMNEEDLAAEIKDLMEEGGYFEIYFGVDKHLFRAVIKPFSVIIEPSVSIFPSMILDTDTKDKFQVLSDLILKLDKNQLKASEIKDFVEKQIDQLYSE